MKRVAFAARYPEDRAHPMHRALERRSGVTRSELLMWGPMDAVTTLSWFDGDPEAVRGVLDAVGTVERSHLVAEDDGTYAFVQQRAYELDRSVLELVAGSSAVFLPPISFLEGGRVEFEAVGTGAVLGEFHDRLSDELDASIERVGEFRRTGPQAAVTDRQRAALEAALDLGYYDVPRTGSVGDVAAELDCARSTAGELLRKAEASLVAAYVGSP